MKIYYLTPYSILRARTNQIGDVRLCEGFSENGCDVELIYPYVYMKENIPQSNIFEAYGVTHKYKLTMLKTPLLDSSSTRMIKSVLALISTLASLRITLEQLKDKEDAYVISRNMGLLVPFIHLKQWFSKRTRYKVIPWVHEVPSSKQQVWTVKNADGVIGTNSAITNDMHERFGIPQSKIAVSLNPITSSQLKQKVDQSTARAKLGLKIKNPLVVYTGKVAVQMKEINYIIEAASKLPAYQFLLTGGKPEVLRHFNAFFKERGINNVMLTGFLDEYKDVIYYQFAADVLISYYTKDQHQVEYNFPNKICEYMLAGKPIVTPDFAATRDVLHKGNAIFVEAENTDSFVMGIRKAVEQREESTNLGKQAYEDVQKVTFQERTKILMEYLSGI